jgi:hypothetical protein
LTEGTEGTLKIGRKMLPPEGSHVLNDIKKYFPDVTDKAAFISVVIHHTSPIF